MDFSKLKWTKNINREDGEWAYSYKEIDDKSKIFRLHWKSDSINNATEPEEGDLIILRQKSKVTHIVELLNSSIYEDESENPWIHRLVKAIWMADVWSEPPHQNDVFDYLLYLQGGKAMRLETMPTFKQRWDIEGGLSAFHKHIKKKLKLQLDCR